MDAIDWIFAVDPGKTFAIAAKQPGLDMSRTVVESHDFRSPRVMWRRVSRFLETFEIAKEEKIVVVIEGTFHGKMGRDQLATLNRRIGSLWTRFALRRGTEIYTAKAGRVRGGEGWVESLGLKGTKKLDRMKFVEEKLRVDIANDHESDAVLLLMWFETRVNASRNLLKVPIEDTDEAIRKL